MNKVQLDAKLNKILTPQGKDAALKAAEKSLVIFKDNAMKKMKELVLLQDNASEQMSKSVHMEDLAEKAITEELENFVQRKGIILKKLEMDDLFQLKEELQTAFSEERAETLKETIQKAMVGNLYKQSVKTKRIECFKS